MYECMTYDYDFLNIISDLFRWSQCFMPQIEVFKNCKASAGDFGGCLRVATLMHQPVQWPYHQGGYRGQLNRGVEERNREQ